MDTFGKTRIVPLHLSEDQFQIYNRISRNYHYSFLFESLTGPEVLAETSVMGFGPSVVMRAYADRVESVAPDGSDRTIATIKTDEPFSVLRKTLAESAAPACTQGDPAPPGHDHAGSSSGNGRGDCDGRGEEEKGAEDGDNNGNDSRDAAFDYRYVGGAVGIVNYDAVRTIEDIPDANGADPLLMEFGIYDDGILYDNRLKRPFYFYRGDTSRLADLAMDSDGAFGRFQAGETTPNMDADAFAKMVTRAKRYIYDGDIFQVVLSRRFGFEAGGDTLTLYRALRGLNPSPYMYHLKHNKRVAIGASPEMLIRITRDVVETFPIAGTRKVTGDGARDARLARELLSDEKELAEHTMLVDLGRNDIGRVCRFGTVRPAELMQIKRFSHVQHIVTHLTGSMDSDTDMFDAFRAVFPAGTVSGAPKVRAMEVIDELESDARGPYAGAVGYFSYNGCCDFAIAIRSIFMNGRRGFVQSGAGIVYDSTPEYEFEETEHKAGAMLQALREASGA